MAQDHGRSNAEERGWRLFVALGLNVGITVAQIVGGLVSGSLSLLADAAHNASDAAALGVSYFAWRLSRKKADERRTFGAVHPCGVYAVEVHGVRMRAKVAENDPQALAFCRPQRRPGTRPL